jgi:hypothetical protein
VPGLTSKAMNEASSFRKPWPSMATDVAMITGGAQPVL